MLGALLLSVIFIVLDVLSVTSVLAAVLPIGINPFWKLSFVFKCLTDSVVLDDFKTALDRLRAFKISRLGSFAIDAADIRHKEHQDDVDTANNWNEPPPMGGGGIPTADMPPVPSPDEDFIRPIFVDHSKRGSRFANADHVEDEMNSVFRNGSRDRDPEENAIGPIGQYDSTHAQPSNPHRLRNQASWLEMGRSSNSTDLDQEYAQAVREMTTDDHSRSKTTQPGIGLAR
jgi:hypothetical protein